MSTFLVTGGSRGLGRAVVASALAAGHNVVAGVRTPGSLDELVDAYSDRLRVVRLDVTDPTAATNAVNRVVEEFGKLDVLVNNAGYANIASVEDVDPQDFKDQVETNFFGVVNVTRAALPLLHQQNHGHIIQISSVGGRLATAGLAAYQASKWAVGGYSSVLAAEVAPLGIKVTVLEPGGMRTDWAGSSMRIAPVSADYQQTVGRVAALHDSAATQASDPVKVARLVIDISEMENPPLRLLVGQDAFKYATAAGRALLAEDERWSELSLSTTADEATAAHLDPLAGV